MFPFPQFFKGDVIDPVIHSMGLRMECNTRRFVIDDKKELQYRVEVQNRVYKKEMTALDAEILKLERILEGRSSTTSSNNSLPQHLRVKCYEIFMFYRIPF